LTVIDGLFPERPQFCEAVFGAKDQG